MIHIRILLILWCFFNLSITLESQDILRINNIEYDKIKTLKDFSILYNDSLVSIYFEDEFRHSSLNGNSVFIESDGPISRWDYITYNLIDLRLHDVDKNEILSLKMRDNLDFEKSTYFKGIKLTDDHLLYYFDNELFIWNFVSSYITSFKNVRSFYLKNLNYAVINLENSKKLLYNFEEDLFYEMPEGFLYSNSIMNKEYFKVGKKWFDKKCEVDTFKIFDEYYYGSDYLVGFNENSKTLRINEKVINLDAIVSSVFIDHRKLNQLKIIVNTKDSEFLIFDLDGNLLSKGNGELEMFSNNVLLNYAYYLIHRNNDSLYLYNKDDQQLMSRIYDEVNKVYDDVLIQTSETDDFFSGIHKLINRNGIELISWPFSGLDKLRFYTVLNLWEPIIILKSSNLMHYYNLNGILLFETTTETWYDPLYNLKIINDEISLISEDFVKKYFDKISDDILFTKKKGKGDNTVIMDKSGFKYMEVLDYSLPKDSNFMFLRLTSKKYIVISPKLG